MRFVRIENDRPLSLQSILKKRPAIARLCRRYGVELLFLHGSLARDRHRRLSDIDLAILAPRLGYRKFLEIQGKLSEIIGREDIDLAPLDTSSSLLAMQVVTKGIPLYVRRPGILKAFRYETTRRYLDSQALRRRFADYVTEAVL